MKSGKMAGTYVSQNGVGEFEIRPFQIEGICQSNSGHSHHYDHWMRINRGAVEITIHTPGEIDGPRLGTLIEVITVSALDNPVVECKRFNGEVQLFHAFVKAELWHTVKALEDNTQYDCCFQHRDFDTGEVVQSYNGNPKAVT